MKNQRAVLTVAVVIALLAIAGSVFYVYQKNGKPLATNQPTTTTIYNNSEYDFLMNFPAGWQQQSTNNPDAVVAEGNSNLNAVLQILVTPVPSALVGHESEIPQTFGNYFPSNYPNAKILSSNPVTLAGQNAYEGEFEFQSGNTLLGNVIVAFAYQGNLYQIVGTTPLSQYQSASSQLISIINSFHFTN